MKKYRKNTRMTSLFLPVYVTKNTGKSVSAFAPPQINLIRYHGVLEAHANNRKNNPHRGVWHPPRP